MFKAKFYITGAETYKTGDVINEDDVKLDINDLLERDLIEKIENVKKVKVDKKTDTQNDTRLTIEDEVSININQEENGLKSNNLNPEDGLTKQGKNKSKK